jgi:hypothetical protein
LLFSNGLITPAAFDQREGADTAPEFGFLGGYEAAFDSNSSDVSIDIQLFRFSSAQMAGLYETPVLAVSAVPEDELPRQSAFPAIPGATVIDGTKASSGFYNHEVVATKGPVLMLINYAGPTATDLVAWAEQQYARL